MVRVHYRHCTCTVYTVHFYVTSEHTVRRSPIISCLLHKYSQENKAFKFKAGFRRPHSIVSTTYQREFNWPDPQPPETPLLQAQHTVHSQHPTCTHTHNEDTPPITNGCHHDHTEHIQFQDSHDPYHRKQTNTQPPNSSSNPPGNDQNRGTGGRSVSKASKTSLKRKHSPKKPDKCPHHRHVRGEKQRQFIQDLMSKQDGRDDKKAQRAKRAHKMMVKQFVTEYQRNFGKSKKTGKAKKSNGWLTVIL